MEKDLQRQWSSKINLEKAWMGGEKASRWLRVPERIYSQLGEYFGVAGKGGSWNTEKKPTQKQNKQTKKSNTSRGKAGRERS